MCRGIRYPEYILELIKTYEPFIVNHELTNPTPEAKEAYEKVKQWFLELGQQLKGYFFYCYGKR